MKHKEDPVRSIYGQKGSTDKSSRLLLASRTPFSDDWRSSKVERVCRKQDLGHGSEPADTVAGPAKMRACEPHPVLDLLPRH